LLLAFVSFLIVLILITGRYFFNREFNGLTQGPGSVGSPDRWSCPAFLNEEPSDADDRVFVTGVAWGRESTEGIMTLQVS